MTTKKLSILISGIMALLCLPSVTNAQVYVDSLGIVQVGNYINDVYGATIQCGGNVKIEAGSVNVVKNFDARRGSTVKIDRFVE